MCGYALASGVLNQQPLYFWSLADLWLNSARGPCKRVGLWSWCRTHPNVAPETNPNTFCGHFLLLVSRFSRDLRRPRAHRTRHEAVVKTPLPKEEADATR